MPEAVVDELELVDVEEQDGDLFLRALGARKSVVEAVDEERTVRQPGERIGQRLAHRVGGARRRERHARVLGEERERAGRGLVERVVAHGGDHEAADDSTVAIDRSRHGRPEAAAARTWIPASPSP